MLSSISHLGYQEKKGDLSFGFRAQFLAHVFIWRQEGLGLGGRGGGVGQGLNPPPKTPCGAHTVRYFILSSCPRPLVWARMPGYRLGF